MWHRSAHEESHAHTNVVDAHNAECGRVWHLAARDAEFKLQIRLHDGVDTVLSWRAAGSCARTPGKSTCSRNWREPTKHDKGDHAREKKTQVFEAHQNDCVGMMMLEQEGLQNRKNKRSRPHQTSRTSRRSRRQ